jgi:hypothetical protein
MPLAYGLRVMDEAESTGPGDKGDAATLLPTFEACTEIVIA